MARFRRIAVAAILSGGPLGAQTVRPAVVEYTGAARGRFDLVNESLFPLTVVLEPRSFHVESSGELIEEPLDSARVRVRLSAMSFRIPPRQSYTVSYEASARSYPAWFLIESALTGARTSSGLNVRIELPHVVYLLQKQPLRRGDVAVRSFDFDSASGKVRIELENSGLGLGRILSSEVSTAGKSAVPGGAFPLFPLSRRLLEIPWSGHDAPDRVMLRFATFTLEERRRITN
jgi:hypothetical protein